VAGNHEVDMGGRILAPDDGSARRILTQASLAADDLRQIIRAGKGPRDHLRRLSEIATAFVAALPHVLGPFRDACPASRWRRWRQLALVTSLAAASPAQADTRAVFVGIDTYKFSAVQPDDARFFDLKGAVNDAQRMRIALNDAYGFGFPKPPGKGCPVADAAMRSLTLLDACATRAAILDAIAMQTSFSSPGDTLIVYLAGHGGRLLDMNSDQPGSQASGRNSTFLPYDARDPANAVQGDILDVELGNLIDKALARGINVVNITDACNSGTVTRGTRKKRKKGQPRPIDVMSRAAPNIIGHRDFTPDTFGLPRGRSVSLSASRDSEQSYERRIGQREPVGGAFTSALIDAIRQGKDGTIADLMTTVRGALTEDEHHPQHPQTEGETLARLGPGRADRTPAVHARLFDVEPSGGKLILTSAGAYAGIARGTYLALFATAREALDPAAKPLADAVVVSLRPYQALLAPAPGATQPLPDAARYAREARVRLAFPRLAVDFDPKGESAALTQARQRIMTGLKLDKPVRLDEAPDIVLKFDPADATASLHAANGTRIAALGPAAAPEFTSRFDEAMLKLARRDDLLARPPGPSGTVAMCIAQEAFDPASCGTIGGVPSGGKVTLSPDSSAQLVLVNQSEEPRYLTVLALGPDNSIRVVVPRRGGHDVALAQNTPLVQTIPLGASGTVCRYFAIATDDPLDSSALVQEGTLPGTDPAACGGAIERAVSPRATGASDKSRGSRAAGLWSMVTADIVIGSEGEAKQ